MKKAIILFVILSFIPFLGNTQSIENLDYISTFNEGLAAIEKNNQWAFVNTKGDIVVNFRDDLVTTKSEDGNYPIFKDGRCLILKQENGISYFGYIDTTGEVVVEPQFLNASNYNNEVAIVLKLVKEELGKNEALGKTLVNYKYYEVVIDINGTIKKYLNQKGVIVVLDKKSLMNPPKITSKIISENLCAVMSNNNQWTIVKINE